MSGVQDDRSQADLGVAVTSKSNQNFQTDYIYDPRSSFSNTPSRVSKGANARSEGVITWHSQQNLDLFWNDIQTNNINNSRDLTPNPMPSWKSREENPTHNSPTTTHNLHQKSIGERAGREVLSPTPPKILREEPNVWPTTRARHRRSSTARQSTNHHTSHATALPPPLTLSHHDTPTPIFTTVTPSTKLARSSTTRHKSMPSIDIPSIVSGQKDTHHLPPLSWKRALTEPASTNETPTESTGNYHVRAASISNLSDSGSSIPPTAVISVKLPHVSSQHNSVWNDVHAHDSQDEGEDEDKEATHIPTTNTPKLSKSTSPTTSSPPLTLRTSRESSPALTSQSTTSITPTSLASPPPTPNTSFRTTTTSQALTSPDPTSPTYGMDESITLSLSVLRQHHARIEETLGARLAVLRSASHLVARNGGWPCGVPFALEHVITHGDVATIVDMAKLTYQISDLGEDQRESEGEDMDAADYVWVTAWLSAVPMMIDAANTHYVLVGLKVLAIMLPILEQWVDTAVGIARSLGPDAIPNKLREQCCEYNEKCTILLHQIDRLEKKGRVGVVANEVHVLLCDFLHKSLP